MRARHRQHAACERRERWAQVMSMRVGCRVQFHTRMGAGWVDGNGSALLCHAYFNSNQGSGSHARRLSGAALW